MRFSSEVAEIANMPWDQPDGYSAPSAFFTISRIMTSMQGRTRDAQEIFSGLVLLFSLASHEEGWATAVGDEERRHACHELNS
jgi:hypothetical protein